MTFAGERICMHRFGDGPKDGSQNIIWKASLKKKKVEKKIMLII